MEEADGEFLATVSSLDGSFEPFQVDAAETAASACYEAIVEANDGNPDSYLGGESFNPSLVIDDDVDGYRAEERQARGRFLMQLSGSLFCGSDVDFCGGGWLFVYEGGAWAEQ